MSILAVSPQSAYQTERVSHLLHLQGLYLYYLGIWLDNLIKNIFFEKMLILLK